MTGRSGAREREGRGRAAGGLEQVDELTDRDRAVLALEARQWRTDGAKEAAIREQLGLAPVRYYQLLNGLLDRPAALVHDPVLVNRLRRLREARRSRR
ncbi:DUF3263 domain-containing protein [Streptacidiphilus sp. PAMC 29251]